MTPLLLENIQKRTMIQPLQTSAKAIYIQTAVPLYVQRLPELLDPNILGLSGFGKHDPLGISRICA